MKKFIFNGKYDGDENTLPQREHPEGYVPFVEPDENKFSKICTYGGLAIMLAFAAVAFVRGAEQLKSMKYPILIAMLLFAISAIPHEFLHALCFKETVYMYSALKKGLIFVIGTEDFDKGRFIFMSIFPSIVFAFIPYIIGMVFPKLAVLAVFGAMGI